MSADDDSLNREMAPNELAPKMRNTGMYHKEGTRTPPKKAMKYCCTLLLQEGTARL